MSNAREPIDVRAARLKLGMTQVELAVAAGIAPATLIALERDDPKIKMKTRKKVEEALERARASKDRNA